MMETVQLQEGQSVLDLGCGCGTNGIFASQQVGENGTVAFVDSNLRATWLTEHNAKENNLTSYEVVPSTNATGLKHEGFDVVLTNPPYFARSSIATTFVGRAWDLLKPGGTCYLVTRQPNEMGQIVADTFEIQEGVDGLMTRGYVILQAQRR